MSIRSYSWAMKQPIKPASKKSVLLVLADYASDTGKTAPQQGTFTRDSGLSAEAVETALAALLEDGIITDTGLRVGEAKNVRVFQLNPAKDVELKLQPAKPRRKLKNEALDDASKIYEIYPRKVGRPKALVAIARCCKAYGFEIVMNGAQHFADAWRQSGRTDLNFCPHPATFFNQERFNDSPEAWGFEVVKQQVQREPSAGPTAKELMTYAREKWPDNASAMQIADWCQGFFRYWEDRKWKQNGFAIDWKIKLSEHVARAKAATQAALDGIKNLKSSEAAA